MATRPPPVATGSAPAGTGPGDPLTASIAIGPMLHSKFISARQPGTQAQCEAIFTAPCYGPDQLQAAYNVQPLFDSGITGAGQTIVIVDSFGSPTIKADLAVFDAEYNLPAPPSLKIIQPAGQVPAWDPTNANGDVSWAGETTLDVEWAHAMAPGANIVLVEATSPSDAARAHALRLFVSWARAPAPPCAAPRRRSVARPRQ